MISRNLPRGKALAFHRTLFAGAGWLGAALLLAAAPGPDWPQWGRSPQHDGASPVAASPLHAILADIVYDPFVPQMKADRGGDLYAHYAAPLADESGVYMEFVSGAYNGFGVWDTLTWSIKKLEWIDGHLQVAWTFDSDWKPVSTEITSWEPAFQPLVSGEDIYVPGLGGTLHRVSKETGVEISRVNPFADVDPLRFVAGGLAQAPDGSIIYDVLGLPPGDPNESITGAWLVRVAPGGQTTRVDFSTLVPGAPAATDQCESTFGNDELPWPPSTTATPPTVPCGAQRPGINVIAAVAPDGTIYTLSRAHGSDRYAYLVAVQPDLTPKWAASLRGVLNDGCGVLLLDDNTNLGCRAGANTGVDPATNNRPAGRVSDQGTASPVVLPDGSVLIGSFTAYNFFRGHLFKFSSGGDALATYDFGWDITPDVFPHDGTYSILLKDNHYISSDGSSYYDVSSLDADLVPEWAYRATNSENCARQPNGAVVCVDDHPQGFEWCVNQPAVDANGVVYLNSEDGTLYGFDRSGAVVGSVFLDTALGAAYTPVSIGPDGILWAQNNGHLYAVGQSNVPKQTPERAAGEAGAPRVVVRH